MQNENETIFLARNQPTPSACLHTRQTRKKAVNREPIASHFALYFEIAASTRVEI